MAAGYNNKGRQVGNYRILAEIGAGGFGKVYQGEHLFLTERSVAIKLLHTHLSSPEECERFLQEALLLEKLKHAHILHVYDVGIDDGFPYMIVEYAPAGSLRQRLKSYASGILPAAEVMGILTQIGQALSFAHQQHIIHRDLKPENILFNAQGEALLADFGIATTLSTASVKAVTITGTPLYMAPEQFQGHVSKESDQYALGCIAYELVTGRPPFNAPDFFAMGFKHMKDAPVPPRQLNPSLPVHVEQAILRALAKQRSNRFPDIRAFINALLTPTSAPLALSTAPQATSVLQYQSALTDTAFAPDAGLTQTGSTDSARQGPETPLPPVTPSFPVSDAMMFYDDNDEGSVSTMISSPGISGPVNTSVPMATEHVHLYNTNSVALSGGHMRRGLRSKRARLMLAVACIVLVACMIGLLALTHLPVSPQSGITPLSRGTTATASSQPTGNTTRHATQVAGKTQNTTPTPAHQSIPTVTNVTSTPQLNPPSPTVTAKPTADPTPVTESLKVPFTSSGVTTANAYSGTVLISVSGTGQASQQQLSDAFYEFTNNSGTPTTPYRPKCWVLNINGQSTDNFVSLPAYNPNHTYTFQITAPGGPLTFNVCDGNRTDNTGDYYITVAQQ